MKQELKKNKLWIIKVGTSSLTTDSGHFSFKSLERIVKQVAQLLNKGYHVILVSSGAIALGMETMKLERRPSALATLQACAAIGQGKLIRAYESAFSARGFHAAQVLLTREGLSQRKLYVNAQNTLNALLKLGTIPVINENDTVATDEIRFGDNDILAALVANLVDASLLVFLSDIEGFYLKDKTLIRHIHTYQELKEYMGHIQPKRNEKTKGGMQAKLEAAHVAMQSDIPIVLVNGRDDHIIERILKGEEVGSLFHPSGRKTKARKKWIAHSASAKGNLCLDQGACRALVDSNKSLLPGGVVTCSGSFEVGDLVGLTDEEGEKIGCGLTNYSSKEISKIKGQKTSQIASLLGYKRADELIHRNNLALS